MTTETVPVPLADEMQAEKYKAAFVFVDAAIAERWLGANHQNRNLNRRLVDRYKADMAAGDWTFTGEAVKFSDNGKLLDGQHRLHAIVETGASVLMLVVRGLDQQAQDVMDTGRKRSAADMLQMHGVSNHSNTAAVARLVIGYRNGHIRTAHSQFVGEVTHSQILSLVDTDPYLTWAATVATTAGKSMSANPSAIGFAAWVAGRSDSEGIRSFLQATAEMRTNGPGDPRYTLANRLRSARDQRERLTSIQQAWLICRAFEAHRKGDPLKILKMSSTSGGPAPFPNFTPLP